MKKVNQPTNDNAVTDYLSSDRSQLEQSSLSEVAENLGYSRWYFSRLFKQATGVTWREYQSVLKINHAIKTLADNDVVINAQLEAGYESAGTFSNVFKRYTGITPQAYRQTLTTFSQQLPAVVESSKAKAIPYQFFDEQMHKQEYPLDIIINGKNSAKSVLFLAFFEQPIAKGTPAFAVCLIKRQWFALTSIPNGCYYAMVCEIDLSFKRLVWLNLDNCRRDLCRQAIHFPLKKGQTITLNLREKLPDDPPILVNPLKLLFDVIKPKTARQNKS